MLILIKLNKNSSKTLLDIKEKTEKLLKEAFMEFIVPFPWFFNVAGCFKKGYFVKRSLFFLKTTDVSTFKRFFPNNSFDLKKKHIRFD